MDNFLVQQDNGEWATLRATNASGVLTFAVTTAAPNSSITLLMPNGQRVRIATVLTAGVHTIAVAAV